MSGSTLPKSNRLSRQSRMLALASVCLMLALACQNPLESQEARETRAAEAVQLTLLSDSLATVDAQKTALEKTSKPVGEQTATTIPATEERSGQMVTATEQPSATLTAQPARESPTQVVPSDTPTPVGNPARFVDEKGVEMVLIPAGKFSMGGDSSTAMQECDKLDVNTGCTQSWFLDEEPVHTIELDDYYIDLTEVTNGVYAQCVRDGACTPPATERSKTRVSYYGNPDYDNYPVIDTTWAQSQAFCGWRGGRLPTEAEWEKAARGTDGRLYPWGNVFDGRLANFCDKNCTNTWANKSYDDGYADTSPVGAYPDGASPYGVLDMAGNVWESVNDWYQSLYYRNSPLKNPFGPDTGSERIFRGGSLYNHGYKLRVTDRSAMSPIEKNIVNGFRCARTP